MRTSIMLVLVAAAVATSAQATGVRRNTFPDNLQGTWAPSAEACRDGDDSRVVISARQYTRADATCDLYWLTVTAVPNGSSYSAQSRCVDKAGKPSPSSAFMIRPIDGEHLSVRAASGNSAVYQRCR